MTESAASRASISARREGVNGAGAYSPSALPGVTNGDDADPKEARRKVETAWQMAKEKGWRDQKGRLIA
jgi:hypothetical protein